jgi:parallel beta-helix repeat protein
MNPDISFDSRAAAMFADDAGIRPPDHLIEDILSTTGRARPRPRWLALLKEPPMRIDTRVAIGSPTARLALILALTLAMVLAASAVVVGAASLLPRSAIVVAPDGSGTVRTIAEAVAMATDGDTILIRPGVYPESVVITANVTIRGDGPREEVVIESPNEGDLVDGRRHALVLDRTEATITGLTLRGERSRVLAIGGAPTLDGLSFESVDISFRAGGMGALRLVGGSRALVRSNRFTGTAGIGTFGSSPRIEGNELIGGPRIWADHDTDPAVGGDPVFVGNLVRQPDGEAIGLYAPTNALIDRNRFEDVPRAIEVGGESGEGVDPVITNNTIEASEHGITVHRDASPTIDGNDISGATLAGISVAALDAAITHNRIHDSTTGIAIPRGGAPTIEGNTIERNTTGIAVDLDASPAITSNTLCGNGTDLVTPEGSTLTLDGNEVCAGSPSPAP